MTRAYLYAALIAALEMTVAVLLYTLAQGLL